MSNLASWWPSGLFDRPPQWLHSQTADRWVFWVALAFLILSIFPWQRVLVRTEASPAVPQLNAGRGGNVTIKRVTSAVGIAGKGGGSGLGPPGGSGGDVHIEDGLFAFGMGGEQGEAGQPDRGGAGGRSPNEVLREMGMWDDAVRRIALVDMLLGQYLALNPARCDDLAFKDQWISDKLKALDVRFRFVSTDGGYQLLAITKPYFQ